jgi:diguanylate cyclase (GGDEF)-like protein
MMVTAVMLLLTSAIYSFALAGHRQDQWWNGQQAAIYELLAVVLLFSILAIRRGHVISKLSAQLAAQSKMTAALQMRSEMLQDHAILDPLTNLCNRRSAMERLRSEVSRAERHNAKLTVMLLGLNDLKLTNDRYGHPAGDKVLQEIAAALRRAVRNSDVAARIGSDEFLLILPDCDSADLPSILGRLSHHSVEHGGANIAVRFAAGWAEYVWGESAEELLERAGGELSKDKATGGAGNLASAARDQFLQKEQLTSMGRLTASVVHDFNNVLTIIKCYTEIVLESVRDSSELHPKVLEIDKAASRAISLTGQLLAFSRKQAIARKVVGLNKILAGMEMMLQRLAGPQITLAIQYATESDLVYVDKGQMEQMVMNLAAIARAAMPEGGDLLFQTSSLVMDAEFCRSHPGARKGEYVCLSTRDSGVGMDPEEQRRILDPFVNVTEQLKDRGLGLTIVYGIVKQNGGYISLDSGPNTGTTASIYLPLAIDRKKDNGTTPSRATSSQDITVLVVESCDALLKMMCEFLRNDGYKTLSASSGEEAIEVASRFHGTIQLAVADLILPGMSGMELVECIASDRPDIKTLYVSGDAEDAAFYDGQLRRAGDFIAAPFTAEGFLGKLRDLLLKECVQ